ncbi:MAG: UMP kinase [Phycisphaerales bacterium]|nr:UMP kinase [Phycisphaerales bacterium]
MPESSRYRKVLLKVSGESLAQTGALGIDPEALNLLAREIIAAIETGTSVAVVVGGGNIVRGAALAKAGLIPQASADYMGMLGTIINGIALKETLDQLGQPARLLSALNITSVAEPFIRGRALRHMEKGRVIILGGGTGNPFCTTDTAAALRATELECDIILKATKVDGVYSSDPKTDPKAKRYERLTFDEAIAAHLKIMDLTAFSMCMEQNLPIVVFDFKVRGNIKAVVEGRPIGTMITSRGG